jgi:flagellar motility protein MotE (MotC chaperone)
MFRIFLFLFSFFFFYFTPFNSFDCHWLGWKIGPKIAFAQKVDKKEPKNDVKNPGLSQKPQNVNVETLRLIERIETKTKELKKREEAVKLKEQQLKDLEKKVKKDLKKIEDAINQGQVLLGISDDLNQENLELLVNIYSSMRPEDAAPLIGALDERIGIPIISRMKSKIAAQILSQMDPKAVKVISEKLVNPAKYKER